MSVSANFKVNGKRETQHIGVASQLGVLLVYNDKMKIVKQTNTQLMEMMAEPGQTQCQSSSKTNEKLPEPTVEMMESMNEDKKEGKNRDAEHHNHLLFLIIS